jgi:hypothetical protein
MEWAFRLAQEPRRLAGRYLIGNSVFSYYALRYLFSERALEVRDVLHGQLPKPEEALEGPATGQNREVG